MNSFVQIVSFGVSLIYGMSFYLLTKFNYFIVEKKNNFLKFIVTFVFIIDMVILYVYLMYKINNGYFHIYFIIVVVLGFILMANLFNRLKKLCQKCVNKIRKKVKL